MTDAPVIVVTGASSGIGRAVAVRFAREGYRVACAARHEGELERTAKAVTEAGGEALTQPTDVSDWEQAQALAAAVRERWGRVDVLVNAAGVGRSGRILDLDVDDFDEQVAINLRGPFLVTKALLPLMLDTSGTRSILNIASVSGLEGMAGLSGYCASKFGVRGFTQSLAAEVSDAGIRAVSVNPGYVATPMVAGAPIPTDEMVQPEHLADFLHYLHAMPESMQVDDVTVWPQKLYSQ